MTVRGLVTYPVWMDTLERVLRRCEIDDCWTWTGGLDKDGYGKTSDGGKSWRVHRLVWTLLREPIPAGMVMDHSCKNRACCNPDHLEPVTQGENLMRSPTFQAINAAKVVCKRGHDLTDPANLRTVKSNRRACRTCYNEWQRGRVYPRKAKA